MRIMKILRTMVLTMTALCLCSTQAQFATTTNDGRIMITKY